MPCFSLWLSFLGIVIDISGHDFSNSLDMCIALFLSLKFHSNSFNIDHLWIPLHVFLNMHFIVSGYPFC